MKTLLIMTAPLLCLLSACSEEADAPVREAGSENVEMPPQPDISRPMMDEPLTEEEAEEVLKEVEAQRKALTEGAESGGPENEVTDNIGESSAE